jgi:phosphopantothenoylcysteine decarboxylase/phosphopantothenate--cysteine ligase
MKGRRVLVGVSGGIAAYKAAELVRLFVKAEAEVRVVMTPAATKFITPLTFQALSQHPVATDTFDLHMEATIGHIELADWAELFVVAPASADVIGRLAQGLANDVLTTVALACKAPLLVAPAMNVNMWQHAAVQQNWATLMARGAHGVGPGDGELACGWVGSGRMSEPAEIFAAAERLLVKRDLDGVAVLVTAGPTWEPIDPVRYVGNRSTGKMGFAVARAAARRGARVTLVAGPVSLQTPPGVERVDVESAAGMRAEVLARAEAQSIIVKAAAVADYRPAEAAPHKLKKSALGDSPSVSLTPNPDILAELGARNWPGRRPLLVGFAAETENVEDNAKKKLREKRCDLVVANDVSEKGSGFGTDTNRVWLVSAGGVDALPQLGKDEVADRILDRALALMDQKEARRA